MGSIQVSGSALLAALAAVGLLAVTVVGSACTPDGAARATPDTGDLASGAAGGRVVVFAAASLTDVFTDLAAAFQQAVPGSRVSLSFGASSQLRLQLEQGARADVFASADEAQMAAARAGGLLLDEPRVFAANRLTLITPADNPRQVRSLRDLAAPGVKLVTAQPSVPIGAYTSALLARASADPAYGPDFQARVEQNVVSREENVRQVVARVQLGEADAGVVYAADVTPRVRDQVRQVALPDVLNPPAPYPIATTRGDNPTSGRAFVQLVLSAAAQETLARWGFLPAAGSG